VNIKQDFAARVEHLRLSDLECQFLLPAQAVAVPPLALLPLQPVQQVELGRSPECNVVRRADPLEISIAFLAETPPIEFGGGLDQMNVAAH
jgi:hypothetical protein